MTLTPEQVNQRVAELRSRGIELVSPFTRTNHNHTFRCSFGHEWVTAFSTVDVAKKNCPICTGKHLDQATIIKRITEVKERGITLLDDFKRVDNKYRFNCQKCNHIWTNTFTQIYAGRGCPKCAGRYLDPETINGRIQELNNRGIFLASPFIRIGAKHDFKCLVCDHGWNASFDVVYRVSGCPRCSGKARTPEEKLMSKIHATIRARMANSVRRKGLNGKPHRNSNGELNEFGKQFYPYAKQEMKKFIDANPEPKEGTWHIDHIVPASYFHPFNLEEMKLCWNHQNLQWLTESENTSKRDKIRPQDIAKFTDFHWYALEKCSFPKVKLKRPS